MGKYRFTVYVHGNILLPYIFSKPFIGKYALAWNLGSGSRFLTLNIRFKKAEMNAYLIVVNAIHSVTLASPLHQSIYKRSFDWSVDNRSQDRVLNRVSLDPFNK